MSKEIKRFLFFFLLMLLVSCQTVLAKSEEMEKKEWEDIENHWAENEIKILLKNQVIEGYGDGTFRPNQEIRTSEFLKILIELENYPLVLEGEKWPDWYIATAKKEDLIPMDYEENGAKLTRSDAAKIIGNYIQLADVKKAKKKIVDLKEEEKETVLKLISLDVIHGYEDGTFRGEKVVTRGEACKIILSAYAAKQEVIKTRNSALVPEVTNIGKEKPEDSWFENRYEIEKDRIYFYDSSRYGTFQGVTLNQEYVSDKKIIQALKALVQKDSYTELKYIPDPYIINCVTIGYGRKEASVYHGVTAFQIKFYENGYYDVSHVKAQSDFMKDATMKIEVGRMWDTLAELDTDSSCSEKNLWRLEQAIGAILGNDVKKEMIHYITLKREEASKIENSDTPKIVEVKKIGKYTVNTYCKQDKDIEIFIQKW